MKSDTVINHKHLSTALPGKYIPHFSISPCHLPRTVLKSRATYSNFYTKDIQTVSVWCCCSDGGCRWWWWWNMWVLYIRYVVSVMHISIVSGHRLITIPTDRLFKPPSEPWSHQNTTVVVSCPIVLMMPRTSLLLFSDQIQASSQYKTQGCWQVHLDCRDTRFGLK